GSSTSCDELLDQRFVWPGEFQPCCVQVGGLPVRCEQHDRPVESQVGRQVLALRNRHSRWPTRLFQQQLDALPDRGRTAALASAEDERKTRIALRALLVCRDLSDVRDAL